MCTVTYVPFGDGFILTSSRDERVIRETTEPKARHHFHQSIYYPRDEESGGSWIAVSEKNRMACLLNGAFEKHERKPSYRKSRGLVLIESFEADSPVTFWNDVELSDIEPFTMLINDFGFQPGFLELRWDGEFKHMKEIERNKSHIWSSATLYDEAIRANRVKWFDDWLIKNRDFDDWNILNFHLHNHSVNSNHNIKMQRDRELQTVSISQVIHQKRNCSLRYLDLITHHTTEIKINSIIPLHA